MFARIERGLVAEVTAYDGTGLPAVLKATFIDISAVAPQPAVGWTYTNGLFYAPVAPKAPARELTSLQFMALFTPAEQTAIAAAAIASPALLLWFFQAMGAQTITLSDPRTAAGIGALVGAGLLTAAREAQVLAGAAPSAPAGA